MAKYYITVLVVRVLQPAGLLLSIALRPFGLSLIYLLLYLIAPLIPIPTPSTIQGCSGKWLLLNVVVSFLMFISHAIWHTGMAVFPPYGMILDSYPIIREIGRNLGFVSFAKIESYLIFRYLSPEIAICVSSVLVYLLTKKLVNASSPEDSKSSSRYRQCPRLVSAGKYLSLLLLMLSGIMRPSITSGIYFLIFMGAATAWAVGKQLERGYAVVGRCVMAIMACHVVVLLAYQNTWLTEMYPPDMDMARYFGLTKLITLSNSTNSEEDFTYSVEEDGKWGTLASPLVILITYFVLALETRELFKPKMARKSGGLESRLNGTLARGLSFNRTSSRHTRDKWKSATRKVRVTLPYINTKALRGDTSETTPMLRTVSPSKKWPSVYSRSASRTMHQDSTGSVVVVETDSEEAIKPTMSEEILQAVIDFFDVIIRSSYIATTITMMAWSIIFHSWLSFVFLMWANIVWLMQDQRSFMLKTSPILVSYAMFLLLSQYVYGMNLTADELPEVKEVNLKQIGLSRPDREPCVPLLIKSLFTCMFWMTLRQWIQEMRQKKQSALLTDMAAPMQLTVSTAASVLDAQREQETRSRLLRKVGEWLRQMCARYWIYVVVIMLFVIGITGERMTIFRIIYMFLCLAFILMFQISWYWWRRLMYVFWITVIIYSMINLILIYIYQFDNFSKTIETYLLINERLQHDLGLSRYHPADLFVKLLTPTSFLIITIMQVHYFHKDFMELSASKVNESSDQSQVESSRRSQAGASTIKDDLPPLPLEAEKNASASAEENSFTDAGPSVATSMRRKASSHGRSGVTDPSSMTFVGWVKREVLSFGDRIAQWTDKIFLFLEIHLIKIIMLSLMLLCVVNVCAMHVPIMLIICPALLMRPRRQRHVVLFISILISVYFMAKMVYQIDYIKHSIFGVDCPTPTANGTEIMPFNNAEWIGFYKATRQKPLVVLVEGYIALIVLFTFYSLVMYRQKALRENLVEPRAIRKDRVIFADVSRADADKDLPHCLMYLINYGFYKFGVEITLMCLMGVIGSRMDLYAVIYAGWLLVLVSISRMKQSFIWGTFTAFATFIVPFQYLLAVGFMPQFCITFPWWGTDQQMINVRNWLFLPYTPDPPHAMKLIFDYFLLLFASRQLRVFSIEKQRGDAYPGGSNKEDIGEDWETPTFVNPVPDFLTYVSSWLDVIKRMVFLGMLWVTLAIMFMTGTNRVNLFSMGYLVGSFIFLWQGTDFYLLPKTSILQWWSWLLLYNVSVVAIKTLLQIPGCMFSSIMLDHACWLVQLLGIGCVDKFRGENFVHFFKMDYVKDKSCMVPQEDIGLAWDGVCFAFLILQRRLFRSYYFYRVIDESKATTILASRGAQLIEELRQKQMELQEEQEKKILEKIKVKMERIKANQRKMQIVAKEPRHHDDEEDEEETQQEESEQVPLVRGDSETSARGYHTPDSPASQRGFHTPISEESAPPSPSHTQPSAPPPEQPLVPAPPAPPSPSSALMTASMSLDAYLEPRRISFGSPPSSELLPRAQSPEESYPVFSPPPIRRRHTVASPSLMQRTSVISMSSRAEPYSHHTSIRSGDYYMFDEFDDTDIHEKDDEEESDEDVPKEMGIGKLLSTAFKTDLKRAVSLRRSSAPNIRSGRQLPLGSYPHSYAHEDHRSMTPRSSRTVREGDVNLTASDQDMDEFAEPEGAGDTWYGKVRNLLETVWAFVQSFLVSLTRYIIKYSRDYRYISRTLTQEKKRLKEHEGFGIGLRENSQMRWEPLPDAVIIESRKLSEISVPEIRILAPSMERGLDASPPASGRPSPRPSPPPDDYDTTSEHESAFSLQTTGSKDVTMLEEQDDSLFKHGKSPFVHLFYALWYALLAHTDIVCYIMVFIYQIQSATILSIPLPLMVFLWGTLTIPRPTKTFWVTLIAYTEVIVLIKSMFQFEILPWNQNVIPENMPFTAPRIIGIERKPNYAIYDLLLLLIIFLHRFMLKSLGLWKESAPEIELRDDMEYRLSPEDTQLLVEGQGAEVGRKYVKLHDREGPRHPLVDRLWHVETTIAEAMAELGARRSDPRVAHLVRQLLARERRSACARHEALAQRMRRHARASLVRRRRQIAYQSSNQENKLSSDKSDKVDSISNKGTSTEDSKVDNEVGDTPERVRRKSSVKEPEAGPSKPCEDDHYQVYDDNEPIIAVTTTIESPYKHFPRIVVLSLRRYLRPAERFFRRMTASGARVTADVYAYMFLCDFFNFLVVIFGFAAFGTHQGDGGVQAYLEENKVPIPFLVMLILQFALIIIDRALYLRKFMLGKILFQYALIIGVHIWMFFVLPFITERTFNALLPPPMWYMLKCIYLLLSAYQIRCGYPRRIIGNFLCKSYRFLNMISFRGFMAVPFVFELRTLMDWIWTDTSMTLVDWLKMEDIFASVYLLKCSRYVEDEFPQPRGMKKSTTSKYLLGGGVLAFVIAIIWFPLVFFAFGNTVGEPNPPKDVTVKIRIGPFLPVYQMSAQSHNIDLFTEQDYGLLSNLYARDRTAQTFLSNYMYNDVAVVTLNPNSTMKWMISPPELERLEREAESNSSLGIRFTFVITHETNAAANPPTIEDHREVQLEAYVGDKRNPERQTLSKLLTNTAEKDEWLNVKTLFPKFLKVFNKGTAKPAYQLIPQSEAASGSREYRDVQLRLERQGSDMFWRVREACSNQHTVLSSLPMNDCNMLIMYTFNDKLFPETLNFISGSGIIGLYTTFVFLASRVIRGFFSGIYTKIMFDDLPNVDRVLQLCLDIYLVREAVELTLEEDLFAKLVFLYRSPETMIKWTRPKEDEDEQRALPPP